MENEDKSYESWVHKNWRPSMGWMYMVVCIFDFVVFPILWPLLFAFLKLPITPWKPLTLEGAGLFHLAMGAVLGVTSWKRSEEKISTKPKE